MDYELWILTMMTWCMTVSKWVSLITVISSRCLPYLCTQEGVSPRIPSNLMTSQHPCGICLHSLILISQSAISLLVSQSVNSSQFRPCPPTDCINHGTHHVSFILTLTSRKTTSTALNHSLHPRAPNKTLSTTCGSPRVITHSIQGKFVCHLSSVHINPQIPHCLLLL